ncbi:ParB/RepB/Spo0J family partition protein [Flavonifractor sp. An91]|uniref:ParB/RepB/Spo0J family partition protein n=1 Tax=Flavonifractor sp. An91 TaxID=1965665 RepID=UPI000B390E03|nr:ParB/RepB/Spo0J family partition protein [Flavonifractor sp. An91]OUN03354.1 chromosome partitioning protein ParB [Flavonifractor sp. An91]
MARNRESKIELTAYDDLFQTDESRAEAGLSKIRDIPISEIDEFPDHPFKVLMNEDMEQLVESVKRNGVMTPATVRLKEDGRYELISGHRRKKACELAGLETLKCEVKELTRDEAIIVMVESNLQRSVILPSEKAFAYKMRLEAMNRQGQRTDLTSRPVGEKLFSVDKMSQDVADSSRQIHRYIRLTELVPEILQMVDDRQIAFRPAVEISYLTEEQQYTLLEAMSYNDATGKLLPCHTCFFTGFLDCLSYRREIKVKIVISFIHKLTTCSLKILPLYFTEMWFLIECVWQNKTLAKGPL